MICKNCGHRISAGAHFCPYCGNNMTEKKVSIKREEEAVLADTNNRVDVTNIEEEKMNELELLKTSKKDVSNEEESSSGNLSQNINQENKDPKQVEVPKDHMNFNVNPYLPPQNYQFPANGQYNPYIPIKKNSGKAIASLVLGLVGMITWIFPFFGLPVNVVGLVFGVQGRHENLQKGMATAGMVLSIIGLSLTAIRIIIEIIIFIFSFSTGLGTA